MAVFKCKTCGVDLEVAEEQYIAECEYCGTKQTVPGSRDENMRALYNRVNNLRSEADYNEVKKLISEAMDYQPCADLLPMLEEKYKEYLEQERIKAEKA